MIYWANRISPQIVLSGNNFLNFIKIQIFLCKKEGFLSKNTLAIKNVSLKVRKRTVHFVEKV